MHNQEEKNTHTQKHSPTHSRLTLQVVLFTRASLARSELFALATDLYSISFETALQLQF